MDFKIIHFVSGLHYSLVSLLSVMVLIILILMFLRICLNVPLKRGCILFINTLVRCFCERFDCMYRMIIQILVLLM